ncbi:MAG TPA: VOC family protein [Thermodesulfobacteriota bacterium]|nr:VOC family protein [Thermodesulfobacteriota bacterium]
MKVNKLDHISIAVKDLEKARRVWEPLLGKSEPDDHYVDESEKIRVARYWIGRVGFELMESTTSDGPVAEWIKKKGEGVMVISLNVNNTREAIDEMKGKEYPFVSDRKGNIARPFRDCEFALIHPRGLNGVMAELIDYQWSELKEGN